MRSFMRKMNYRQRLDDFMQDNQVIESRSDFDTAPMHVLLLPKVIDRYRIMKALFSYAEIYYAVKANNQRELLAALMQVGAKFEASSRQEIDDLLTLGVPALHILFSNPTKLEQDIQYANQIGIQYYVSD